MFTADAGGASCTQLTPVTTEGSRVGTLMGGSMRGDDGIAFTAWLSGAPAEAATRLTTGGNNSWDWSVLPCSYSSEQVICSTIAKLMGHAQAAYLLHKTCVLSRKLL